MIHVVWAVLHWLFFLPRYFIELVAFPGAFINFPLNAEEGIEVDQRYGFPYAVVQPKNANPRAESKRKCIVFFHGNACNLVSIMHDLRMLADNLGVDAAAIEYYRYKPYTETVNPPFPHALTSAVAVRDAKYLIETKILAERDPGDVFLVGHSVGTGIAAQVAKAFGGTLGGTILISPYLTPVSVISKTLASLIWPFEPLRTRDIVASIGEVCIIHGTEDEVIPFEHGEELAQLAQENVCALDGARHNDSFSPTHFPVMAERMKKFMRIE